MFYKNYKRNNLGEIVTKDNIDSYIPVLNDDSAQEELLHLQNLQNEINKTKGSWDDYSGSYKNGRGYLLSYAKEHDVLKSSVNDIKRANIKARESTISYNSALQQQTLGAKASTLALKGLALVGNVVASVLISMVVSKAISFFYDLATAAKQAKESAENFASEFSGMQTTQNQNASTIANLSEEYESLSSHVDSLGRVTGLTTEETQRYHDICNQVAGIMPNLVQGYDAQGNAILSVKDNLSDLNKEYELYRKNEANTTYNQTDDKGKNVVDSVFKNYKNANNKLESMPAYEFDPFADYIDLRLSQANQLKGLKYLSKLNDENLLNISNKQMVMTTNGDYTRQSYLINILKQYGLTADNINSVRDKIQSDIDSLEMNFSNYMTQISSAAQAYAQMSDRYWGMTDESKQYFQLLLNNITPDIVSETGMDTKDGMENYINSLIRVLKDNKSGINTAFEELLSFDYDDTNLNPDEISNKVSGYINTISETIGVKDKDWLLQSLGFDNLNDLSNDYALAIKNAQDKFTGENFDWNSWFEENSINTQEEIDRWNSIADAAESAAEARMEYVKSSNDFDTTSFETSMKAVDALNTALSAQSSQGYLKTSDIKTLLEADPNYEAALQETAAGLTLNTQKAKELTEQNLALRDAEAKAAEASEKMKLESNTKQMKELAGNTDNYQKLLKAIDDGTINDVSKNIEISAENLSKFQNLATQNDGLRENIKGWQQVQYELLGANSLLKQYNDAQSTPDESDAYSAIVKGRENADELYKNGWITKDDFTSYANLVAGYGESEIEAIQNYKKNVERLKKYMTTDDSGNVTSKGLEKFLQDSIKSGGIDITKDANGNDLYNIESMDELAKKMNVTTEFAEDMIRALNDAGYSFPIVATEAYKYSKALKEVDYGGEDAVESVKSVIEQLQTAKDNGVDVSSSFQEVADAIVKLEEAGQDTSALKQLFAILTGQEYTPEVKFEADTSEVEQAAEEASKPETKRFTFVANADQLNAQINQLKLGQTINFNAQVNGQNKVVSATKDQNGVIHYTAEIDDVETELKQVRNEKGSVYFEADTTEVQKAKEEMEQSTSSEHKIDANVDNNASDKIDEIVNKANSSKATITVDAATGVAQGKIRKFLQYIAGVKPKINIAANATNLRSSISNILNRSWSIKVKANVSGMPKSAEASGTLKSHASGTMVEKSGTAYNVLNMKAHASGTPVGLKSDEEAVVNELGKFCRV